MSKDEEIYLISRAPMETVEGRKSGGGERREMVFAAVESAKRSDYLQIFGTDGKQSELRVFVINREDADLADQIFSDGEKEMVIRAGYVEYNGVRYRMENQYGINEFELKLTCSEVD